ncbi:hypothetical protein D3C72_2092540 [compost metagenome]
MHFANRRDSLLQRRIAVALITGRTRLGHAIRDGDFTHVHIPLYPLHHFDRAGRTRQDAGAQGGQVELVKARVIELCNEHRRHSMQRRAPLVLYGLKHQNRVE